MPILVLLNKALIWGYQLKQLQMVLLYCYFQICAHRCHCFFPFVSVLSLCLFFDVIPTQMPGADLVPSLFKRAFIIQIFALNQATVLKRDIFWPFKNKFLLWQKCSYFTLKCGHYSYFICIQWSILFLSFIGNIKKQTGTYFGWRFPVGTLQALHVFLFIFIR